MGLFNREPRQPIEEKKSDMPPAFEELTSKVQVNIRTSCTTEHRINREELLKALGINKRPNDSLLMFTEGEDIIIKLEEQ